MYAYIYESPTSISIKRYRKNDELNQVKGRKSFKFCINNLNKSKVPLFSFKLIEDSKIPLW